MSLFYNFMQQPSCCFQRTEYRSVLGIFVLYLFLLISYKIINCVALLDFCTLELLQA